MSDDGARGEQQLLSVVAEARGRLRRIAGRELLAQKAWWVVGAGAVAAACRPLVWRLASEAPLWLGIARAAGLFAAGSAIAAGALIAMGRRRGPSEIGAARALDGALGSAEVIASGHAFARDGRGEPVALIARRRAAELAATARVAKLFPLPSSRPTLRGAGVVALAVLVALGVGGYERGLAAALLSPPTPGENVAAAELENAAAVLAEQKAKEATEPAIEKTEPKRGKSDEKLSAAGPALADKAKEAARAARRGDRRGALEKIEELRSAGQQKAARAGDIGKMLRKVAEALAPPGDEKSAGNGKEAGAAATPSKDAAESMRLLANKMKSPEGGGAGAGGESKESKERVLERLERAAEEARRASGEGKSQDASEAARALSRAAESLRRGDREAASQALAEAAERAAAMEQARAQAAAEAMAIMELLEKSGALERAIQMAMLGRDGEGQDGEGEGMAMAGAGEQGGGKDGSGKGGKDGEGQGSGGKQGGRSGASALRRALLARLAAVGAAPAPEGSEASNGSGPHQPDRGRSKRDALAANGSIRAPSQVGEGPRAIQAINGLGRGTEPPEAYREVFPSYDAAAEEGLADERIPAQRRAAVRRYFKSIRPE